MKKIFALLAIAICSAMATQTVSADKNDIKEDERLVGIIDYYYVVDEMPEFPGGIEGLMNYFQTNLRYPVKALESGVEGRVVLEFIVETDGTIGEINVINHVDQDLDAEAIRVISKMPRWKPGMVDGEPVRCIYTLPISFKIPREMREEDFPVE